MRNALPRKFWPDVALAACGLLFALAAGEDGESVRQRTARAYDKYQNCGLRAA